MSPVIVISGLPGAGSTTIGKETAKRLKLKFFSSGSLFKDVAEGTVKKQKYYDLFSKILKKHGVTLPEMNEKNDTIAAQKLWDTKTGSSLGFHESIDELQKILAARGNIVIDGKLSIRMIKNADLKVWLTSSLESRIKKTIKRDSLKEKDAKYYILEREKALQKGWKKIYDIDLMELKNEADIVIDTSEGNLNNIVNIICKRISD